MTPSDKQLLSTEELSLLDEREREAWELCQRVTWQGDEYLRARNLLPALLSKVARLTRERDESFNEGIRVQTAFTNDQRRRAEAAESRISDLTKELKESNAAIKEECEQKVIALTGGDAIIFALATYAAEERRAERKRCAEIARGEILLPINAFRGTMKELTAHLAEAIAAAIEQGRG